MDWDYILSLTGSGKQLTETSGSLMIRLNVFLSQRTKAKCQRNANALLVTFSSLFQVAPHQRLGFLPEW